MYISTINANQKFLNILEKVQIDKTNNTVTNLISNLLTNNIVDSSSFNTMNGVVNIPQFQQHNVDNTDLMLLNDNTHNQKVREIIVHNKFINNTETQTVSITPENIGLISSDITTSNIVVANPNIQNLSISTSTLTNTTLYCISQLTPQTITINNTTTIVFQKKANSTQTTVTINGGTSYDYNINDTFTAGNMTFKVGSLTGTVNTTGGGSGDPYITTLEKCELYKLPGKIATYRLFHSKNIIVNADVAPIKSKYAEEIARLFRDNDVFDPKLDGFYFDKFYININNNYFVFDEAINLLEMQNTDDSILIFQDPVLYTDKVNGMSSKSYKTNIIYNDELCGRIIITLKRDLNPQIINGIDCTVERYNSIKNITGALVRRSNTRNYEIKKITDVKPLKMKYETTTNYHFKKEMFYEKI
jgi:hypothetical protein